ncbi:MAG TPA: helix-turn-helix transcriptional regulator [Gemmataceae bacterium]|nr:helix-turn-helix transcriptional regulator [Gemmataceae bacterium]
MITRRPCPGHRFRVVLTPAGRRATIIPIDTRRVKVVARSKSVAEWMADRGLGLAELVAASSLDERVVEAIVRGRYTPSPEQRQRLSGALGVEPDRIAWGHSTGVDHMYGHGPQFGRSP